MLRDGQIQFNNGYTLKLKGRRIERIAMTWMDYGGLQDKYFLTQLFNALLGTQLSTTNIRESKKFGDLNEAVKELGNEAKAMAALGKNPNALFMNCWFLSVPQLMLLLDGITQPSEFDERLGRIGHMSYRTLDFYRDFCFARHQKIV